MYCSQCGRPNENEANFCKQCGAQLLAPGSAPVAAGPKPQPKRGCCPCSCAGMFFGCSVLMAVLFGIFAYVVYTGPEAANKFFAAPDAVKSEMASLRTSDEEASRFEKNLSDFASFIQKGSTVEIHVREGELNSWIVKRLPAVRTPKNEFEVRELKARITPDGIKLMGVARVMKFESYFMAAAKASVAPDGRIDYSITGGQFGKAPMPAALVSMLLEKVKSYAPPASAAKNNPVSVSGLTFTVIKISFADGRVILECAGAKPAK